MTMKMTMKEFVERQNEFKNFIVRFTAKRNSDGKIMKFERIVNDEFCDTNNFFTILEVEILGQVEEVKISYIFK